MSPGVAPAAGVEAASASDPLSAEEGRTAAASAFDAGEECSAPLSRLALGVWSEASPRTWCSASGESFKVTTKELGVSLEVLARLERPLVEPAGGMMEAKRGREGEPRVVVFEEFGDGREIDRGGDRDVDVSTARKMGV